LRLPNQQGPEGRMRLEFDQLPLQKNKAEANNIKPKIDFKNTVKFSKTDPATGNRYTYLSTNGKVSVEVYDRTGTLIYDGPYNTDIEKASVPDEFQGFLKNLSKGKDNLRMKLQNR